MKERVLNNLKKLREPESVAVNYYRRYIEEAIDYIERSQEPYTRTLDADWLQKRVLDDIYNKKCDGLVFTKINSYIHEFEVLNAKRKAK